MLEASTARARKSVFDEGGHAGRELVRFKTGLGEMLKRQQVSGREYCEYIINFTAKKFARQANKLQKYLEKIERGEDTCLR
jgi:predicted kinase